MNQIENMRLFDIIDLDRFEFVEVADVDKKVIVLSYDKAWKSAFEEIKKEIKGAIGDLIIGIEHVGSTSVEGMSAKHCIDIDVIIKNYSILDSVVSKFRNYRL